MRRASRSAPPPLPVPARVQRGGTPSGPRRRRGTPRRDIPPRRTAAGPHRRRAMSTPRSSRARRIPSRSTRPWYWRATRELLISRMNTSRLSSDRLYSVSQPAKNWPAAAPLPARAISAPNATASAIVAAVHNAASPSPSGPRRRALTKRSAPRRTARAATVAAQAQGVRGERSWHQGPGHLPASWPSWLARRKSSGVSTPAAAAVPRREPARARPCAGRPGWRGGWTAARAAVPSARPGRW